jgi:hypothetical protein
MVADREDKRMRDEILVFCVLQVEIRKKWFFSFLAIFSDKVERK